MGGIKKAAGMMHGKGTIWGKKKKKHGSILGAVKGTLADSGSSAPTYAKRKAARLAPKRAMGSWGS